MAQIWWLDDDKDLFAEFRSGVFGLERRGHNVRVIQDEAELLSLLGSGQTPDLLIQDLMRPTSDSSDRQIQGGSARSIGHPAKESGWKLYEEVLRPYFPQLPVVVCSFDAEDIKNQVRADDFNIILVDKAFAGTAVLQDKVEALFAAQSGVFSTQISLPKAVRIDFQNIGQELISRLADRPQDIHQLSWQGFELLIAELLTRMGYEVTHTPFSRDGGADLWAVRRNDLAETLYAIDTKKYARGKIVGPAPVRAIYGVTQMANASVGMIVTTARFGPSAVQMARQHRYRLSLKDFTAVSEWLRETGSARK